MSVRADGLVSARGGGEKKLLQTGIQTGNGNRNRKEQKTLLRDDAKRRAQETETRGSKVTRLLEKRLTVKSVILKGKLLVTMRV